MIDQIKVLSSFHDMLLNKSQQVDVVATGERIGIRDVDYDANPSLYTQPGGSKTPIVTQDQFAFEGQTYDPAGKYLWIEEIIIPANEIIAASTVNQLNAVYQLNISVPQVDGLADFNLTYTTRRLIAEVLDQQTLPYIDLDQANTSDIIIFDSSPNPRVPDDVWYTLPLSVTFRIHQYKQ